MHFSVNGLHRRYQGKSVLHDVNFQVGQGELVSIVGPSGVGKTTLLRILAGLDAPSAGRIDYAEPLTRDHPVILVFQDYQLFPNLDVAENVEFGLRARGVSRVERQRKVREILGEFGMLDHAAHYPNQLLPGRSSGWPWPGPWLSGLQLLLLDEPFANLDPSLKMQTADFIRQNPKKVQCDHCQRDARPGRGLLHVGPHRSYAERAYCSILRSSGLVSSSSVFGCGPFSGTGKRLSVRPS